MLRMDIERVQLLTYRCSSANLSFSMPLLLLLLRSFIGLFTRPQDYPRGGVLRFILYGNVATHDRDSRRSSCGGESSRIDVPRADRGDLSGLIRRHLNVVEEVEHEVEVAAVVGVKSDV
jgi:hypothetical protein